MFSTRNALLRLAAVSTVAAASVGAAGPALARDAAAAVPKCPTWSNPVPAKGAIINMTDIPLGVFHLADGKCPNGGGAYDQRLPAKKDTFHYFGWAEAAGVYVGPGYTGAGYLDGDLIATPVDGPNFVVRPKGGNWQIYVWKKS
ncbi:hypothetical protein AB0F72_25710 [Actinoplanes sp. NPDC023936]|uniref:hypothetical protein n=1 Tax=Actinoplanes sp. NPDC023936 TaxID=3154910 RepID=UPI0033CA1A36